MEIEFPPLIIKNLSDKSQDKKKQAAKEIENIVRMCVDKNNKN